MAGDWVAMRLDLAEDEAVIYVAEKLGMDPDLVVGKLHRLWSWANRQLSAGESTVSPAWIDRHVGTPDFAATLAMTGWLQIRSTGVVFPKFDVWNSKSAKKRLLAARRKTAERDKPDSHIKVTKMSRSQRDKNVTREEKRKEENTPPDPPGGGGRGEPPDLTPRRVDLAHALILPPLVQHAMQAYGPELQTAAWGILQEFLAYSPGNRSTSTLGKIAAAFADVMLANPVADRLLREYFAVKDPRQIELEFVAGSRLRPGASPWEICEFLFPPAAKSSRPPPPADCPTLAREKARQANAKAVSSEQFAEIRKQAEQGRAV